MFYAGWTASDTTQRSRTKQILNVVRQQLQAALSFLQLQFSLLVNVHTVLAKLLEIRQQISFSWFTASIKSVFVYVKPV